MNAFLRKFYVYIYTTRIVLALRADEWRHPFRVRNFCVSYHGLKPVANIFQLMKRQPSKLCKASEGGFGLIFIHQLEELDYISHGL